MKKIKAFHVFLLLMAIAACSFFGLQFFVQNLAEHKTFGFSAMTMNNEFYQVIQTELIRHTKEEGDTLVTLDPELNLDHQIEQVNRMIDMDIDGIFLNPIDSDALADSVERARNRGIPVVILDAPLNESAEAVSTVASDNYQAGVITAQYLVDHMQGGRIGLLEHSEVASARERIQGLLDTLEHHQQFVVTARRECRGQLELAMPAVEEMIQEDPQLDVIFALNDPSALGCLAALEREGKTDVQVFGVDGTPDVKKRLLEEGAMQGTVAQSPSLIAERSYQEMMKWLVQGNCEKEVIIPVTMISRENISDYDPGRWQ